MRALATESFRKRQGTTLVELMMTLAIFGVVLGVVFSFLVGTRNSYTDTRERVQYQQSLRAVISLLTREIRSTGCDPLDAGFDMFTVADVNQIGCQMDLNGDADCADSGPDESVVYVFDAATGTLSRDVGAGAQVILRGLTGVTFSYFDEDGLALAGTPLNATDRANVSYVEVNLVGESERGEPIHYVTRVLVRNG
jgi:prepilin-type N-terminal cleavage/methylation domain-containing protein